MISAYDYAVIAFYVAFMLCLGIAGIVRHKIARRKPAPALPDDSSAPRGASLLDYLSKSHVL